MSSFTPVASPPEKEPPVPIGKEAGWVPEPVWTLWRRKFPMSLPGIDPGHPAGILLGILSHRLRLFRLTSSLLSSCRTCSSLRLTGLYIEILRGIQFGPIPKMNVPFILLFLDFFFQGKNFWFTARCIALLCTWS
jgi:hypothetical protein